MTNLGLKTLNVVPHYYHHTLPTMWEALSTFAAPCVNWFTCWRTALAMSSRVANCLPRMGSLILGTKSKSQSQIKLIVTFHRISSSENGYFNARGLLKTGYFHLAQHSPTD
ncbi:UNVERIFIED_CONTAM: hypothetical protein NCL1_29114 [Trichonephila clavipes]